MELKPATTYYQQVELIKSKGFVVDDDEKCVEFLKTANYYRLSAYFLPFKIRGKDEYYPGYNFNRIERIYDFDTQLRSLIFKIIEQIEFYVRTQLAYEIAHAYGPEGYLNEAIFNKKHNHDKYLERINECINENRDTLVVKHHNDKYDGKFPVWVVIEFFHTSMLSKLFADLNSECQKKIAKDVFGASVPCLKSWLRCLSELRNRCAHYSRLYYWLFPSLPRLPKDSPYVANRQLFTQFLVLKLLYPNSETWNERIVQAIDNLIEEYCLDISMKHIGFPNNWKELLIKR